MKRSRYTETKIIGNFVSVRRQRPALHRQSI